MTLGLEPATIIVVDHDEAIRAALKFALELDGFRVETHASGEALSGPDLPRCGCLVIDQDPGGLDGLGLVERLRAGHVELPAVLIATQPTRAVRQRAAAAGVPIVEKPLMTDALLLNLQRVLWDAR